MWPIRSRHTDIGALIINGQSISLGYIRSSSSDHAELKKYTTIALSNYDIRDGVIYNTARFQKIVEDFFHQLPRSAALAVVIGSPHIKQEFLYTSHSSLQAGDVSFAARENHIWQHEYLYPGEDAGFYHYVSGLHPSLLYQYQSLVHQLHRDVARIESLFSASLKAYKRLYAGAYRALQLRQDLTQHNGQLMNIFSRDNIMRLMKIDRTIAVNVEKEKESLVAMIGVFKAHKERA